MVQRKGSCLKVQGSVGWGVDEKSLRGVGKHSQSLRKSSRVSHSGKPSPLYDSPQASIIGRSVYVYLCLCMCLSIYLPLCLSVCLSVCPSVRPSVRLSVFVCPSVCLSLSICLVQRSFECGCEINNGAEAVLRNGQREQQGDQRTLGCKSFRPFFGGFRV